MVCLVAVIILSEAGSLFGEASHSAGAATVPQLQAAQRRLRPSKAAPRKSVSLPALDPGFLAFLDTEDKASLEKRMRIGIGRSLSSSLEISGANAPASAWTQELDGTFSYSVAIKCVGAQGARIHLEDLRLPDGAVILMRGADETNEVSPLKIGTADDIWCPGIFSETGIIECRIAHLADAATVHFTVNEVSHFYRSLKSGGGSNYSCIPQIACYPAWLSAASGVAMIQYVSGGSTYLCTGCLLSTTDSSFTNNYFLTAHHCISSQTVAATMQAFWLYQATNCGGAAPNLSSVPTSIHGATLLATGSGSDFTLMRLVDDPPTGSTYLGWTTLPPAASDTLLCIQHPGGGDKRISFGQDVDNSDPNLWGVAWNIGVTTTGSSGSPLLLSDGSVIGQLFGGNSNCSWLYGEDLFGRFGPTYQQIKQWIDPLSQGPPTTIVLRTVPMTNSPYKLSLSSTPSTHFYIQGSEDLANWETLGSATTDSSGKLTFQDTNSVGHVQRFYRAAWAAQSSSKTR
jgi:hypothetical protein